MKNIISNTILVIFILISSHVLGQNASNSKGKQGPWTGYYKDGKTVRYVGQFLNGKQTGKFVFYYITGEPEMVVEHKPDGTSDCKMYHINGALMASGAYVNQLKEGVWWFFNDAKQVIRKEVYANGFLSGNCYTYFPAAEGEKLQILKEEYYEKGLTQGPWKQYYKDGKLQTKGNYKNGLYYGECIWYSPSEKPETYGYYNANGQKDGRWRIIKSDGTTIYTVYRNDVELKGKAADLYLESLTNKKTN